MSAVSSFEPILAELRNAHSKGEGPFFLARGNSAQPGRRQDTLKTISVASQNHRSVVVLSQYHCDSPKLEVFGDKGAQHHP